MDVVTSSDIVKDDAWSEDDMLPSSHEPLVLLVHSESLVVGTTHKLVLYLGKWSSHLVFSSLRRLSLFDSSTKGIWVSYPFFVVGVHRAIDQVSLVLLLDVCVHF